MPIALLTFHHIKSPKKVTALRDLCRDLALSGIFRRGYPGVVFVAGSDAAKVVGFTKEVKRMRWQTCTVNGWDAKMEVEFEENGLQEVDKVRDVVHTVERAGGEEAGDWVKRKMGFYKEDSE